MKKHSPTTPYDLSGPAPRPDLEGRKMNPESLGEDPFPDMYRLHETEEVEVVLTVDENGEPLSGQDEKTLPPRDPK